MRAVDTNVLVRLLVRDDAAQVRAAEAFIEHGAWVSKIVLVEAVWVLDAVLEVPAARIASAIGLLLQHAQLTVEDADTVSRALNHYRTRPALGFSDCLVLECARQAGHLPLGTFDKSLARLPGAERL